MSTWGVAAMESDEGLDLHYELVSYSKSNQEFIFGEFLDHLREEGTISEDAVEDLHHGIAVLALSEILVEYMDTGKVVFFHAGEDGEEEESSLTNIQYTAEDIRYLTEQLQMLLDTTAEQELNQYWAETDRLDEWEEHVGGVLENLEDSL